MKKYWRFRITNICNADCSFCHGEGFNRGLEKCFMPIGYFKTILSKVSVNDNVSITGGEPLLHPNAIEIIQLTVNKIDENCHLNTNGILLEGKLEELKRTKLSAIHVNLSTLDEVIYEKLYNIPFPKRLMPTLEHAKSLNFEIIINSVIIKNVNDTLENINSLIQFCSKNSYNLCFIEPYSETRNLDESKSFQIFFHKILTSFKMTIQQKLPSRLIYYNSNNTSVTIAAPCSPAQAENGIIEIDAFVVLENQLVKRFNKKDIISL
jgi:cyclic pyranopterin phosphate synthase